MSLPLVQDLIGEIIVDRKALENFLRDRNGFCEKYGLESEEQEYLLHLKAADIEIFRRVIEGTREERLKHLCPEATQRISPESWFTLVTAFHQNRVVPTNEDHRDVLEFAKYVDQVFPNSALGAWVWHGLLRALPIQALTHLPKSRFCFLGRNAVAVQLKANPYNPEDLHDQEVRAFLYVFCVDQSEDMSLVEVDIPSYEALLKPPYASGVIESLRSCGVQI